MAWKNALVETANRATPWGEGAFAFTRNMRWRRVLLQSLGIMTIIVVLALGPLHQARYLPVHSDAVDHVVQHLSAVASSKLSWLPGTLRHGPSNGTIGDASVKEGNATLRQSTTELIAGILDPNSPSIAEPRLECPTLMEARYAQLRYPHHGSKTPLRRFYFALNLHQSMQIIQRLLGSIIQAMEFLGPEQCVLSIVEGRSNDGTYELLQNMRAEMDRMGVLYNLNTSEISPWADTSVLDMTARVTRLAKLRNMALQPLLENRHLFDTEDTTVIFLNDVAACAEDILELMLQRKHQGADMSCGMDWNFVLPEGTFYDVWISRSINGDSYFKIPEDGNWAFSTDLFHTEPGSRAKFDRLEPLQVFSCWNGGVVFSAKPFWVNRLRFRGPLEGECKQGEPKILSKELWYLGYGKILLVPTVNFGYNMEEGKKIKELKGYVSSSLRDRPSDYMPPLVNWRKEPPALVRCIQWWTNQTFIPWDEHISPDLIQTNK